jgi:ribosomal protein L33
MVDKINYLNCPMCGKEYYVTRALYLEQAKNPKVKLMCPYCRKEFYAKDAKFVED